MADRSAIVRRPMISILQRPVQFLKNVVSKRQGYVYLETLLRRSKEFCEWLRSKKSTKGQLK